MVPAALSLAMLWTKRTQNHFLPGKDGGMCFA